MAFQIRDDILDISGDDVRLELTGIALTTIEWSAFVSDVKELDTP